MVFHLKKQWFDKIKSGEKTHEYRVCSRYWDVRISKLLDKGIAEIIFVCGYPPAAHKDQYLKATVKAISRVNGSDTDLQINRDVWNIEFELVHPT